MVQVRLFSAVVRTSPPEMQNLEDSMNTFLKQHANDAIESIQVSCTNSTRLRENEFIGVGMITYIPQPIGPGRKAGKKKAAKK